jgi:IS1 family transposase
MYVYERQSGEIAAYLWGKRDMKNSSTLKQGIS